MAGIFLLIPDSALCEAVIEQIKAAHLSEPQCIDTLPFLAKTFECESGSVLIVDSVSVDKRTMSIIQTLTLRSDKLVVLVLGEGLESESVTETFALPIRLGHLVARLRYYLETAPLLRERVICFGPYRLEPQNRRIIRENNAEPIRLTEKETAILVFLSESKQPAARRDILAAVWGYDERIDTHTLETHIYQLRRKLEQEGSNGENWLLNEDGAYRLTREHT